MDLTSYEILIKTESSARKFLVGFCWKNHQRHCPRCRSRKLYKLAEGRRRCANCAYTFHDFSGRHIAKGDLSPGQWLRVIKLFEYELGTAQIAEQMRLAYNTTLKTMTTIRTAIAAHCLDGPAILAYLDRCAKARAVADATGAHEIPAPVFGIIEKSGLVFVDLIPDITTDDVLHYKRNFRLKTSTIGRLVYTDAYRRYQGLVFSPGAEWSVIRHQDKGLALDASKGFWRYAKDRLKRHRGVSPERFPLYIKELEFRYNHRGDDIFSLVAAWLCDFVPVLE